MRQLYGFDDRRLWIPALRIAASVLVYVLVFLLIYPLSGARGAFLSTLPVMLVGWSYGLRAGVTAGLLTIPLNLLLVAVVDDIQLDEIVWGGGPGLIVSVAAGAVVGYLREAMLRLKSELAERQQIEAHYQMAIGASGEVPYYLDYRTNTYPMLGEGFQQLTGYPPEMVGHELWDAIRLDIQLLGSLAGQPLKEGVERVRSGEVVDYECNILIRTLSGEARWLHDVAVQVLDERGKPIGSVGILQDITERKRAEEREVRRREWLEKVLALSQKVTQTTDWEACLLTIYESVRFGLQFDRVGLFLYDEDSQVMRGAYGTNRSGERTDLSGFIEPLRDGVIFREGLTQEQPFAHVQDYSARFPDTPPEEDIYEVKEHASIGVWSGDRPVLMVAVDNLLTGRPMIEEQLEALRLFAGDAGLAIENARLYAALQRELAERKQAEAALRSSEARYRKTIVAAGAVPYSIDYGSLTYTFLGEGILPMTGYSAEEMTPQLWKTLEQDIQLLGELAELPYDEARRRIRSGEIMEWKSDSRIRTRTGETRWVSDSSFQIRSEDGTVVGAIGILQDITLRKQAEAALRASEERFRYAAMATRDAIYDWDMAAEITFRNEAYQALYFPDSTVQEDPTWWEKHIHPDDRTRVLESLQQAFREGNRAWTEEYRMQKVDGSYASVIDRAYIVYDSGGKPLRMIGAMTDITERLRADAQRFELALVKERAEVLKEFLNTISHDLKTPLTIINNSLYLLQKVADPEYQKARLDQIKIQSQRLEKLIQDILTVSRLDAIPELTFEPLNINQVVDRLSTQFQGVAENRHLTINLELDERLPPVQGSEDELYRVLVNLVENALHYTPPEGEVTLRTFAQANEAVVEVRDTGIGISEADLPHIFDHFYRTDKARATATGGTGLGLSIVKKIVDMHNGSIEVDSTVGRGTTFRVRLRVG